MTSKVILYKNLKNGNLSQIALWEEENGVHSQIGSRPAILVQGTTLRGLISKKLREGYRSSEEPSQGAPSLLMYSQNMRDKPGFLTSVGIGWVAQPKLNGVRCSALLIDGSVKLYTKKRKEIVGLNQLKNSLKPILEKSSVIMDGEIYCHGMRLQKISGLVRRSVNIKPEEESKLSFHIFDVVNTELPFRERYNLIPTRIGAPNIHKVPCFPVTSREEIDALLKDMEAKGFEGIMLRHLDSKYLPGFRSEHLLKYKSFQDAEFEIVGYKRGTGKDANIPIFACKTSSGECFDVKMEGIYEENKKLLHVVDTLLGKMLTVRFFDYTERGVPEFPVGVAVRDYE